MVHFWIGGKHLDEKFTKFIVLASRVFLLITLF